MICIGTIDVLKVGRGVLKATTTITGPNDARHVIWALGESLRDAHGGVTTRPSRRARRRHKDGIIIYRESVCSLKGNYN